jgi:hypothetical protein
MVAQARQDPTLHHLHGHFHFGFIESHQLQIV